MASARPAVTGLTASHSQTIPAAARTPETTAAGGVARRPAGRGRARVRTMSASTSRSSTWFIALVPEATSATPAMACTNRAKSKLAAPRRKPAAALATTSAVMRGFVSSRYEENVPRIEWTRPGIPAKGIPRAFRRLPTSTATSGPTRTPS